MDHEVGVSAGQRRPERVLGAIGDAVEVERVFREVREPRLPEGPRRRIGKWHGCHGEDGVRVAARRGAVADEVFRGRAAPIEADRALPHDRPVDLVRRPRHRGQQRAQDRDHARPASRSLQHEPPPRAPPHPAPRAREPSISAASSLLDRILADPTPMDRRSGGAPALRSTPGDHPVLLRGGG
jgi:hypothetical protein